jgi:hypothetical protein
MPAASTNLLPGQVSDFEDNCLLIQQDRLLCDFCSSGQRFACGFLQIPPRGGHPCRPANTSPCRACRGLDFDKLSRVAPPSGCALPGAQHKYPEINWIRGIRVLVSKNLNVKNIIDELKGFKYIDLIVDRGFVTCSLLVS